MPEDNNTVLFAHLVLMFQGACMQHLGKVKSPVSDAIERDLPQAQAMIDLLEMLQQKTKGNLSKEEETFLTTIVKDLKLNYVDEVSKGTSPQDDATKGPS